MYVNKCIKCGREFETKNPKRVICPDCLYPDKSMMISESSGENEPLTEQETEQLQSYSTQETPRYYSAGGVPESQQRYNRPQQQQRPRNNYNTNGGYGYNKDNRQQGNRNNNNSGGYNRPNNNNRRQGGYNQRPQQGGYNRDNRNNFSQRRSGGNNRFNNNNRRPSRPKVPRQLLVSKEQLEQIELLYKVLLPLPNPDCHEVIGEKIGLEPRKVFFGINLIRQKLMLPKLPFPKRKLAISPDQLFAIKNLYEPLLPLPPIGCHKIIAAQLKMDEWRVHVGIGLIRSQMGLKRWNQDRPDAPEEYRNPVKKSVKGKGTTSKESEVSKAETDDAETEVKPKRGRKPKKAEEAPEA